MANTDPKYEVGDKESPEDRAVKACDAETTIDHIANNYRSDKYY